MHLMYNLISTLHRVVEFLKGCEVGGTSKLSLASNYVVASVDRPEAKCGKSRRNENNGSRVTVQCSIKAKLDTQEKDHFLPYCTIFPLHCSEVTKCNLSKFRNPQSTILHF